MSVSQMPGSGFGFAASPGAKAKAPERSTWYFPFSGAANDLASAATSIQTIAGGGASLMKALPTIGWTLAALYAVWLGRTVLGIETEMRKNTTELKADIQKIDGRMHELMLHLIPKRNVAAAAGAAQGSLPPS